MTPPALKIPELLIMMFCLCKPHKGPWVLSVATVCRLWRQVTLDCPDLWEDQFYYYSDPDAIRTVLQRSRKGPSLNLDARTVQNYQAYPEDGWLSNRAAFPTVAPVHNVAALFNTPRGKAAWHTLFSAILSAVHLDTDPPTSELSAETLIARHYLPNYAP